LLLFGYKSSCVPFILQNKLPKLKHLKKGEKFKACDVLIEQIIKKNNEDENYRNKIDYFSIVYEDAILKLLEMPLMKYVKSEVPYHKITQVKFFNDIIWDRNKRYFKYDY
jgi:hypothetical protein